MKKPLEKFEIGKFYKHSSNDRIWVFCILEVDEHSAFAYYVKKSRYQNYIMDNEMVSHEPKDCIEITSGEFLKVKTNVISKLIENPIS